MGSDPRPPLSRLGDQTCLLKEAPNIYSFALPLVPLEWILPGVREEARLLSERKIEK